MPFKSEKQRKWMHANKPKMAKKWEKEKKMKKETRVRELIKKMVREIMSEMNEGFAGALKKEDRKKFDKGRKKQSEVLGYTLTGKDDIKTEIDDATVTEAKKRDYKAEYKKFQSSTKSKKYRAELNKYNRQKGTYGNGDGKDASHKGGKIVGFEEESKNRGRAEKSRLKKEGKYDRELISLDNSTAKEFGSWKSEVLKLSKNLSSSEKKKVHKDITTMNKLVYNITQTFEKNLDEGKVTEAISGSDRKIMFMIVRDIIENLKKAGAKKPSNQIGRGVLSILRAMTYTPDNANYKNYKKYFPKTFNSKLTQKRVAQFHKQTDKVQLTMVKQAMNKVLGEGKLTEKKMDRKKAAIILKQIGGNRFIAMTGAKGFAFSDKYMSFKIGRNSKGINFVRIGHNAMDTYDMEFGFVSVKGLKVKKKVKGVYADMLGTMFKKYTGMNVSL